MTWDQADPQAWGAQVVGTSVYISTRPDMGIATRVDVPMPVLTYTLPAGPDRLYVLVRAYTPTYLYPDFGSSYDMRSGLSAVLTLEPAAGCGAGPARPTITVPIAGRR